MTNSPKNKNLHTAKRAKNDEFYTQLDDIADELRHYKAHFQGKTVYCNCDDPRVSNFVRYFAMNFAFLGLRKLIATCYKNQDADLFSRHDQERAVKLEYTGHRQGEHDFRPEDIESTLLEGDGDFRSAECTKLLDEADIVVTNPPFSLFREYVVQLVEHDKRFLIIGNKNAITYREVFPLIRDNRMWIGHTPMSKDLLFDLPDNYAQELRKSQKAGSAYRIIDGVVKGRSQGIWFTNMDHAKRHEELPLWRTYDAATYPHYDNYDAINVNKVVDIPADWNGPMGVPISFLDKHNPDQFEILGTSDNGIVDARIKTTPGLRRKFVDDYYASGGTGSYREGNPTAGYYQDGVANMAYKRIFIRNRKPQA